MDENECQYRGEWYPEHEWNTLYDGPDGWQAVCSRCDAETWQEQR